MGKRPRFSDDQRRRLAVKASKINPERLKRFTGLVSPRTLLEWHRRLVVRPGRPPTAAQVRALVHAIAQQNRTWGYTHIQGALRNLGHEIGREKGTTWKEFLRIHWDVLAAADFFTAEVWTAVGLVRYHVLLVMRLAMREVHIAGIIPEPNGNWMKQMGRNLTDGLEGFLSGYRYLIHSCCGHI